VRLSSFTAYAILGLRGGSTFEGGYHELLVPMAFDECMEQVRRLLRRRRLSADPDHRAPLITQSGMAAAPLIDYVI
jgi:hypothetical protein